MRTQLLASSLFVLLGTHVLAAPLSLPDLPAGARDSLQVLQSKGLIEGYPDGTLKDDRVASRYEVAMIVARLLASMEKTQLALGDKASAAALRQLTVALHDELAALDVRLTNLEQASLRLDKRVTELERITFYGSFQARLVAQSFYNTGQPDNDASRAGAGYTGVPYLDYNTQVGAKTLPGIRPQTNGVIPVVDYRNGRALVSGAGFSSVAILGMKIKVSDDIDAGAEFAAYSAQGNSIIDAYQGVSAPQSLNPFTSNQLEGGLLNGENHQPWTRMVIDNLWVVHKPSKTKLRLGSIEKLQMDKFVYRGEPNLGIIGPAIFPGYGAQLTGESQVADKQFLRWEIFGTLIGDLNTFNGKNYRHQTFGADLDYDFGPGGVKLNIARFSDASALGDLTTGLLTATNVPYGASTGWTPTQWVNPNGYLATQTTGTRPITWTPGKDTAAGLAASAGPGNIGPQEQTTLGASFRYGLNIDESKLRFNLDLGRSNYAPNAISSYTANGDMERLELTANPAFTDLEAALAYVRVDPRYNPALLPGNLLGIRFVRPFNFVGRFNLYDTTTYPTNREGLQMRTGWKFDEGHGEIGAKVNLLRQTTTSLYDVRLNTDSIALGTPTNPVLGFSPGFLDPVFSGFASPLLYGKLSASSFTADLQPLENPRGTQQDYGLSFSYRWDDPGVKVETALERSHWFRPTSLDANFGGSQNAVDLSTDYARLGVSWKFATDWTLRGGCEWVRAQGHFDPGGLYNGYAVANQSTTFQNLDSLQTIPNLGFDWQLSSSMSWSNDFRFYSTVDHSSIPAGNNSGSRGVTANPFNWSGPQITTDFKFSF